MITMTMSARAARLPQSFRVRDLRRFERTSGHPISRAAGVEPAYRGYEPPKIPAAAGIEKGGDTGGAEDSLAELLLKHGFSGAPDWIPLVTDFS
jgi:hypothetical protein